jgi:hypothetical protein
MSNNMHSMLFCILHLANAVISGGNQRETAEKMWYPPRRKNKLHGAPNGWQPWQHQRQMQQPGRPQPSQGYATTKDRSDNVESNVRCKRPFNSASPLQQYDYLPQRAASHVKQRGILQPAIDPIFFRVMTSSNDDSTLKEHLMSNNMHRPLS